jgi:hypothetical protein
MTITNETPVVVSSIARSRVDRLIREGKLSPDRQFPPRWLDAWIDMDAYRNATSIERREMAAEGLQREYEHNNAPAPAHVEPESAEDAPATPVVPRVDLTPARLSDGADRARAGTPYVPCASRCGALLRRPRPAVAYCPGCGPKHSKKEQ